MKGGGSSVPSLSTPKAGGALKGLGEKFSPDLFTGTGNFSIPIEVPAGRNGMQPSLQLSYSTGQGNGGFGLGWALSVPGVSRSTSRGLPSYDDEADKFILSGSEDLVALPPQVGQPRAYRPRTEGLFALIEHTNSETDGNFWRVRSKDGMTSYYGTPKAHAGTIGADWIDPAATQDPSDAHKIYAWHLTRSEDTFGNRIEYVYVRDQGTAGPHTWDVPRLDRIRYVNYGALATPSFLIEIVLEWEERPDPFSAYRASFEVRTTQRCKAIRTEVNGHLQRIVSLSYAQSSNGYSRLSQLLIEGVDLAGTRQALPPLTFSYTDFEPAQRKMLPVSVPELSPGSLLLPQFALADITGNGLPDIVEMSGSLTRYWDNLGNGQFSLPRVMKTAPAGLLLGSPGVQLLDSDGNGRLDLMVTQGPLSGVYPMRYGGHWDSHSFRPYKQAPSFDLRDPEVQLVDLNGDGAIDALRASPTALECFFQDQKEGWKEVRRYPRQSLDNFPAISFADPRVRWADMKGDGMQDLVLVHSGRIEYWPSLGHGRFGRRVELRNAPRLPFGFNPKRILLGDVDGDGCADLIYVEDRQITLWLNQGGERFAKPVVIAGTPAMTDEDTVRVVDLLGIGTAGLLFVLGITAGSRRHMFFLDLTGRIKPNLLAKVDNHIGVVTSVTYESSIEHYLRDQRDGRFPWKSPLPFPVQVLARSESVDTVSATRHVSEYAYHHGYWDGADREFRGFGRVDQRDSETRLTYYGRGLSDSVSEEYFSPPIEVRSWFHQGPQGDEFGGWFEADYSQEYWDEDPSVLPRSAASTQLLGKLPRRALRDALRALRGRTLRTELYALDGSSRQSRPYTVTESIGGVSGLPGTRPSDELLPTHPHTLAEDDWRLHVFFSFPIAERTAQWERGEEPVVAYQFTDRFDAFGQAQEQVAIAVPRSRATNHLVAASGDSAPYLSTLTRTSYAHSTSAYVEDRVASTRTYEVLNTGVVSIWDLLATARTASDALDAAMSPTSIKLLSEALNYYDGSAFVGMTLGQVGLHGALVRSEQLMMDEAQLEAAYGTGNIPPFLTGGTKPSSWPQEYWDSVSANAGYRKDGTRYYAATARLKLDIHDTSITTPRGLPIEAKDAMGRVTKVSYDASYQILPIEVTDPADLITLAEHDFHFFQTKKVTDPNGNQTSSTFTPLGLVKESFIKGKTSSEGDQTEASQSFTYNFSSVPISATVTKRQYHDSDTDPLIAARLNETIVAVSFSDGLGREVQTRTQAEAIIYGTTPLGGDVLNPDVTVSAVTGTLAPQTDSGRVIVSAWKRYDNKGRVVESAEPYFASGFTFSAPSQQGSVQKMFYDARGQLVRTSYPDGSESRVIRGTAPIVAGDPVLNDPNTFIPTAWEVWEYDANDNAGRDGSASTEDLSSGRAAKSLFTSFNDTPTSSVIDALGRKISLTQRLTPETADWLVYTSKYDVVGNLLEHKDPKARIVSTAVYDYAKRPLKAVSQDAGNSWALSDAAGAPVYATDARGALRMVAPDAAGRPKKTWARDLAAEAITLRIEIKYGDEDIPDSTVLGQRRDKNLLGKPWKTWDEAGRVEIESYDFKGNVTKRTRKVISDQAILDVFSGFPVAGSWLVPAYRVDWEKVNAENDLDSTAYTTEAAFDALGRIKWSLYPVPSGTAPKLIPTYNRGGGLEKLVLDSETLIEFIGYNAKSQRVLVLANCTDSMGAVVKRILTRYAYDKATFRLVRMRSEACTRAMDGTLTPQGNPLQDTGYVYDRGGNIWKLLERADDSGVGMTPDTLDRLFTYDALYRLLSATGRETQTLGALPAPADVLWADQPRSADPTVAQNYAETYKYDEVGFMTELKRTSYPSGGPVVHKRTFAGVTGNNRLQSVTYPDPSPMPGSDLTVSYLFDDNGNMTKEGTSRHFEWDHSGRMRVFRTQTSDTSEPSVYAHYLYDASGQRVKKFVRKQTGVDLDTVVYIDGVMEHRTRVRGITTDEGLLLHLMDGARRVAKKRIGETFDGKPDGILLLEDHLSSASVELDLENGDWVDREEYRPYGETSFGSYELKRYRFTGKERNEESGLNYHSARYYALTICRWLTPDPKSTIDGTNLYCYVRNNPLRFSDSSGTEAKQGSAKPPTDKVHSSSQSGNSLVSDENRAERKRNFRHVTEDFVSEKDAPQNIAPPNELVGKAEPRDKNGKTNGYGVEQDWIDSFGRNQSSMNKKSITMKERTSIYVKDKITGQYSLRSTPEGPTVDFYYSDHNPLSEPGREYLRENEILILVSHTHPSRPFYPGGASGSDIVDLLTHGERAMLNRSGANGYLVLAKTKETITMSPEKIRKLFDEVFYKYNDFYLNNVVDMDYVDDYLKSNPDTAVSKDVLDANRALVRTRLASGLAGTAAVKAVAAKLHLLFYAGNAQNLSLIK